MGLKLLVWFCSKSFSLTKYLSYWVYQNTKWIQNENTVTNRQMLCISGLYCPTMSAPPESLPQVEEFKYLGFLFTSDGRMEQEIDRRTGESSLISNCRWCCFVLSSWRKLSIYWSVYLQSSPMVMRLESWLKKWNHGSKRTKWASFMRWPDSALKTGWRAPSSSGSLK